LDTPSALFMLVIFGDRVSLFAQDGLDHDPITGFCHNQDDHTQPFPIEMGLHKLFCPG
jgi:hypothetical protein